METESKFKLTTKDIGYIITILTMIVGFFVKIALVQDQVARNTKQLTDHSLEIISYRMDEMKQDMASIEAKVDRLLILVKEGTE